MPEASLRPLPGAGPSGASRSAGASCNVVGAVLAGEQAAAASALLHGGSAAGAADSFLALLLLEGRDAAFAPPFRPGRSEPLRNWSMAIDGRGDSLLNGNTSCV